MADMSVPSSGRRLPLTQRPEGRTLDVAGIVLGEHAQPRQLIEAVLGHLIIVIDLASRELLLRERDVEVVVAVIAPRRHPFGGPAELGKKLVTEPLPLQVYGGLAATIHVARHRRHHRLDLLAEHSLAVAREQTLFPYDRTATFRNCP